MYQHEWIVTAVTLAFLPGCITINPINTTAPASTPIALYVLSLPPSAQAVEPPAARSQRTARIHSGVPKRTPLDAKISSQSRQTPGCTGFVMPELPQVPRAPLTELDAVPRGDAAAALALAEKHIVDLHHYIIRARRKLDTAYQDYQSRCHAVGASTQGAAPASTP
jgi:hypothetical protein